MVSEISDDLLTEAWLCRALGKTPNDSAMLYLFPEQKRAMYNLFLSFAPLEQSTQFKARLDEVRKLSEKPALEFIDINFQSAMTTQLGKQGMSDKKIKDYILKIAERKKVAEIEELNIEYGFETKDSPEDNVAKIKEMAKNINAQNRSMGKKGA